MASIRIPMMSVAGEVGKGLGWSSYSPEVDMQSFMLKLLDEGYEPDEAFTVTYKKYQDWRGLSAHDLTVFVNWVREENLGVSPAVYNKYKGIVPYQYDKSKSEYVESKKIQTASIKLSLRN